MIADPYICYKVEHEKINIARLFSYCRYTIYNITTGQNLATAHTQLSNTVQLMAKFTLMCAIRNMRVLFNFIHVICLSLHVTHELDFSCYKS